MTHLVVFSFTAGLLLGFAARCAIGYQRPLPRYLTTYMKGGRR